MINYFHVSIRCYDIKSNRYCATSHLILSEINGDDRNNLSKTIDELLAIDRKSGLSGLRTNVMVRDSLTNSLVKWTK